MGTPGWSVGHASKIAHLFVGNGKRAVVALASGSYGSCAEATTSNDASKVADKSEDESMTKYIDNGKVTTSDEGAQLSTPLYFRTQ
jgi:hypothetical protein